MKIKKALIRQNLDKTWNILEIIMENGDRKFLMDDEITAMIKNCSDSTGHSTHEFVNFITDIFNNKTSIDEAGTEVRGGGRYEHDRA